MAANSFLGTIHITCHIMGVGHARNHYPNHKEGDVKNKG